MKIGCLFCTVLFCATPMCAQEIKLTPQEIADGWIMLFDGHSGFGWKTKGQVSFENGKIVMGGSEASSIESTSMFASYQLKLYHAPETQPSKFSIREGAGKGQYKLEPKAGESVSSLSFKHEETTLPIRFAIDVPAGERAYLAAIFLKPLSSKPLFNGKDLSGWKALERPDYKAKYSVTSGGELRLQNGPGDLQTTEEWGNFILQLDAKTNGKHLNSGIFFRAILNRPWSGYEAQIRNEWKGEDRTKPVDFGTGAIYNRQPARKVVSNDNEYFTMTINASGNHLATWVNGYQVTDFTDTRPVNESARQGQKTKPGPISLQAHDVTTDLVFKNIRLFELPK